MTVVFKDLYMIFADLEGFLKIFENIAIIFAREVLDKVLLGRSVGRSFGRSVGRKVGR